MSSKQYIIYTLKLENNKFYVGKTQNMERRFNEHKLGTCEWTRINKPISILSQVEGSAFDEDRITKELMSEHGIDNVRGGSYVSPNLRSDQRKFLEAEIIMSNDLCLVCKQPGHFAKSCPQNTTAKYETEHKIYVRCKRCERFGHTTDNCYAKTDANGLEIVKKCNRCGRSGHATDNCYAKTDINGRYIPKSHSENNIIVPGRCARCQGDHMISECNAVEDIVGHELVPLGKEISCLRCGSIIYTNRICGCPTKGFKGFVRLIGDIINSISSTDERCERCNKKNHNINECSEYADYRGIELGTSSTECSVCGVRSYYVNHCPVAHTPH